MKRFTKPFTALLLSGWMFTFTGCNKEENIVPTPIVLNPTIESVSPGEGTVGTELTIKGTNFQEGASIVVGAEPATVVDVESATLIYVRVPSGIPANMPLSVTIKHQDGGENTLPFAFTAVDPVLSFVNSATKPSGNIGSTVILEGKAFSDVQGEGQIFFSDGLGGTIAATITNSEQDWTNTFIVTTVPQGAKSGPVYVVTGTGTSNSLSFMVTDGAAFSPSEINWSLTAALPLAVSGHQALYVPIDNSNGETNQFVFVSGGRNSLGEAQDQVLYGQIQADGTISAWNSTTSLPGPLSSQAAIAATPFNSKVKGSGYVYTIGGANAEGNPVATVSYSSLNEDGTLNTWNSSSELPEPLHSLGAVIFRSTIYIAGGATNGNTAVAKVYKADIDTLGNLSPWEEQVSLPSARAHHGFVTFGGYLYAVGGDSGNISPDDANFQSNETKLSEVVYAKVNIRTGAITETGWTLNANSLQKSRSKHTTLVAGGSLFVSSGLYSGAGNGSSENTYAQIFSDGTIGSFGGATGSNTLASTGGNNLFNQTGISYVDADGKSHIMIIGGDDVKLPGIKQADVIYY